jgi:hypothetical protein
VIDHQKEVASQKEFLMNKKIIFISMLIVLLACCFFSCEEPPQLSIIVTGIPSTTGYNYGAVALVKGTETGVAASLPMRIANGQFTGELLNRNLSPFTDTGTYNVVLYISSDSAADDIKYTGVKISAKVDVATTIQFSQFYAASGSIQFFK